MLEYNIPKNGNIYTIYNVETENKFNLPLFFEHMGHFNYSKPYFTKRSNVNSYLIFFTQSGQGMLNYNNKKITLSEGDFAIVDCNKYHYYETQGENWNFKWMHLKGSFIKTIESSINNSSLNKIKISKYDLINNLFEEIHTLLSQNDLFFSYKFNNIMTRLLTEIYLDYKKASNKINLSSGAKTCNQRFIDYVKTNYINPIYVEAFCDNHNISKYKFIREFKTATSYTPYKFVTNYRISKSRQLLRNFELNIGDIGYMVGYNDPNIFIRAFKKVTGKTPFEYRNHFL